MFRRILVLLTIVTGVTVLSIQAEPAPTAKPTSPDATEVAAKQLEAKQRELLRRFKIISDDLAAIAERYEKSGKIEDQERAKRIRKAIDFANEKGIENRFQACTNNARLEFCKKEFWEM